VRLWSAIVVAAGFLLLASHASARGIDAREWVPLDGAVSARQDRLSIPVPNTITATVTTRELREVSLRFGRGCELAAEVSVDGGLPKSVSVPARESRREVPLRAPPGEHLIEVGLTPGPGCVRGRALLEASSIREWIPIGTEVGWANIKDDRPYRDLIAQEVDSVTDGNDLMWATVEPQHGVFDFSAANRVVGFARDEGLEVRGHPLVWRHQLPKWLKQGNWSREEAIEILRNHIHTVVGRYADVVDEWDVVNEPIGVSGGLRRNFFMDEIGREYIGLAFLFAREADPDAKLYMNEYLTEVENRKSNTYLAVARELLRLGVPIDGVGFQFHVGTDGWVESEEAGPNLSRFAELGLEIQISEMDVPDRTANPGTDDRRARQAEAFREAARACRSQSACTRFTTWGLTDRYSWLGQNKQPLPFDRKLRPKPAWGEIEAVLRPAG
jgi:endo-1,4-beta-xylanase